MTALEDIRTRIAAAAARAGRSPEEVRLIAVSKRQPLAAIEALAEAGQRDFGESQVQEALDKLPQLAGRGLCWHFIGHLQSNKTRFIPGNFQWVHSIDSEKMVRRIATAASEAGETVSLLLQVNVAADPAKFGIQPAALPTLVERLLEADYAGVRLRGLMTIGRRAADAGETRRSFAELRELLQQCRERFGKDFSELSMGMSGDFELAVEEGATMVRVGTALFGERPTP